MNPTPRTTVLASLVVLACLFLPRSGEGSARDARSPGFRTSPGVLRFSTTASGAVPEPLRFGVFKEGEESLRWRARASRRWISLSPASGTKEEDIEVRVDPSRLEPGLHAGTIMISSTSAPDRPRTVEVLLEVREMPLYAGFRSSRYGIDPFPDPSYWAGAAAEMARRVGGAVPAGIWIVGVTLDDGTCELNFPGPGGSFPKIVFFPEDQNEEFLTAFDAAGISVWLQVEPGDADLPTLVDLVLGRYGRHPCVTGFGIDVEWLQWKSHQWGRPVTDAEAVQWLARVRAGKPSYSLFLKHWLPERMPPAAREGLFFIDDSQGFASLDALLEEFRAWGQAFWPSPVGFQFGYDADRPWWAGLGDPPASIGIALRQAIPNLHGLIWVDFTLKEVFPDSPRPRDRERERPGADKPRTGDGKRN